MMEIEPMNKGKRRYIDEVKDVFTKFIQTFSEKGEKKYIKMVEKMTNNNKHLIIIGLKDFLHYDSDVAHMIFNEYYTYEPILNEAFTSFMKQFQRTSMNDDINKNKDDQKINYEVTFDSGLADGVDSVRELKANLLGKLRSFRGTVTRTLQVRPELISGVFRCKECGYLSKAVRQQFKYTEPKKCGTANCDKRHWELDLSKSQFADFQKIRVQQDPSRIPPGGMPRSIDVILRNQNIEKGQPGDICNLIGYLCVSPDISSMFRPGQKTQLTSRSNDTRNNAMDIEGVTGVKGIRQLNYKMIFIATNIVVENSEFNVDLKDQDDEREDQSSKDSSTKKQYNEQMIFSKIFSKLLDTDISQIMKLKNNPNLYQDMAESLFSSIFGQTQIKKALLLQLFSGIHKITQNKINIRGDINILIVGDPSTAKSQFLKSVNRFVPRSVYTNGKTTSAAGLTASVTRDENGNVGIEAGALMLADNGICCIDQFDKMDIKDQVAIHEAMQQQTISIAKAGVYATLNARTSILAAANPIFGRYDKSRTLKHNINLSAPIMSRFDLFFVLCDESNDLADDHLSRFIIDMHRGFGTSQLPKIDEKTIKNYISVAKKIKPRLSAAAAELLKKNFMDLRRKDKNSQNNSYRVTVRQLESMIRLSEAYARLKLELVVTEQHVRQAYRLLSCSILKLQKTPVEILDEDEELNDGISDINKRILNIVMEQEMKKKEEEKKKKLMFVSHELFEEVKRNTLKLFKQENDRYLRSQTTDEYSISQEGLCQYLMSINYQNGQIFSEEQTISMKKIINALIKKMIEQERILMVQQDSRDLDKKMLSIHINFVE